MLSGSQGFPYPLDNLSCEMSPLLTVWYNQYSKMMHCLSFLVTCLDEHFHMDRPVLILRKSSLLSVFVVTLFEHLHKILLQVYKGNACL